MGASRPYRWHENRAIRYGALLKRSKYRSVPTPLWHLHTGVYRVDSSGYFLGTHTIVLVTFILFKNVSATLNEPKTKYSLSSRIVSNGAKGIFNSSNTDSSKFCSTIRSSFTSIISTESMIGFSRVKISRYSLSP